MLFKEILVLNSVNDIQSIAILIYKGIILINSNSCLAAQFSERFQKGLWVGLFWYFIIQLLND